MLTAMRSLRTVAAVAGLLAGGVCFCVAAAPAPKPPPNVVLIISDDQAWTDYGFMGHPHIRTPHLDRLASESLLFPHGYVPTSLCCPSLASIITGLYPHQTRVTGNEPPRPQGANRTQAGEVYRSEVARMTRFLDGFPTLPNELARRGYVSFQSGKWWMGHPSRAGFTDGMTHGDPDRGGRHGDEGLKIGRQGMQPIFDFIEGAAGKPFFVWYAPFLPHTPHNPPQRLLEKYRGLTPSLHVAKYWAMCEWFDETCGELLNYLEAHGHSENTVIVYVTDNGWIQRTDAARYRDDSKRSQYDAGLRTPIMVRWPGRVQPRTINVPISSIDLAPTILQAGGLQPTRAMPGVNLLDEAAVRAREAIFGACFLHNAVDLDVPERNLTHRWCVEGRWKLVRPDTTNVTAANKPGLAPHAIELYDLIADPHEMRNLADAEPRRVADMTALLNRWWPGRGN
jgi:uncharacterized sulfatase